MFVSRVVRAGRTFVRRMIDVSKCVKHLHHKITLDNSMKADIQWWIEYLPSWNCVSVMYDTIWSSNINLHLWSDASDVGIGGYFDGRWLAAPLTDHMKRQTIAWRELYALVVALSTWSQHIQHKRILFYIDNAAIVHIINNGCSKNKDLMTLVRSLFCIAAGNSFEFRAEHISSADNAVADALSRGQMYGFRQLALDAELYPSQLGFVPLLYWTFCVGIVWILMYLCIFFTDPVPEDELWSKAQVLVSSGLCYNTRLIYSSAQK